MATLIKAAKNEVENVGFGVPAATRASSPVNTEGTVGWLQTPLPGSHPSGEARPGLFPDIRIWMHA